MRVVSSDRERRVLDFDVENRPLSYWWGDATTGELTAIAWSWVGQNSVQVAALGEDGYATSGDLVRAFLPIYREADLVTGHFIRRHDLPLLNAACIEFDLPLLDSKRTADTKLDCAKTRHLSLSQEALGALLGVEAPKVQMTQSDWREANRLTPEGIELTKARVVGDVIQHKQIYTKMLERGMLKAPSYWHSVPGGKIFTEE